MAKRKCAQKPKDGKKPSAVEAPHLKSNTITSSSVTSSTTSSPTDWLASIGNKNGNASIGDSADTDDCSNNLSSTETSHNSDSELDINGVHELMTPTSGMRPNSFYGPKLHSYSFSFHKSPQRRLNGENTMEDATESKSPKSAKRKLKSNHKDSRQSKKTKKQVNKMGDLSIPLCDIVKNSPSPRSSPIFMLKGEKSKYDGVSNGNLSSEEHGFIINGTPVCTNGVATYSGLFSSQGSTSTTSGNIKFDLKSSPVNSDKMPNHAKHKTSMSVTEEVMYDLGSLCSEESVTSGFGSINSGIFLKGSNGEYVFSSSNSSSPELSTNGFSTTPSTPDKTLQNSDECLESSSLGSQTERLFGVYGQSDISDKSYSPSPTEGSTTPNTRSPELQTSITKFFKSSSRQQRSPTEARQSSDDNSTPLKKQDRNGKRTAGKTNQMYLDLGQRDFGHVTCSTCGMVYTCAQPDDEAAHIRHHKKFVSGLRFNGWKNEKVLQQFVDGRIIVVAQGDHPSKLKKVDEIRGVVDSELGFADDLPFRKQESKTFLFIANKKVIGCCVATHIDKGYPVLPSTPSKDSSPDRQIAAWCCSSTPVPAQCGISRIWVWNQCRRKRVASRLIDCVRNHFIYGCTITKEALAFSDPTPDGKRLATSYIGSSEFLVFR